MSYPQAVDQFITKLNRRAIPYVIQDEVIMLNDGLGESFLAHDNVKTDTLEVWTGPGKTGVKIVTYTIRSPGDTPWKTLLRVMAPVEKVYVTYESLGDQVEAEDMNTVQSSLVATQTELERHKADLNCHIENGEIDGGSFV
ncbi:MAG: phosphoglucomutase [Firmicutes bacterium]|nr:phosphoglucomutase [Bacillota bacterium]